MTISALPLPLPLPSRLPRATRGGVPAPQAARVRAAERWAPGPGSASGELPQLRRVVFAGSASSTALPVWIGWTMPAASGPGADAA